MNQMDGNKTGAAKPDGAKRIIDIITVVMLVGAFGLAYYTGLVGEKAALLGKEPMLSSGMFALVSIAGVLVLMLVGSANELIGRVKTGTVTLSFSIFAAVQVFALIGMCAIMIALNSGAFTRESTVIRILYILFAAIPVIGYAQSILYTAAQDKAASEAAGELIADDGEGEAFAAETELLSDGEGADESENTVAADASDGE